MRLVSGKQHCCQQRAPSGLGGAWGSVRGGQNWAGGESRGGGAARGLHHRIQAARSNTEAIKSVLAK